MKQPSKTLLSAGVLVSALGASLCCILPIVVALAGVGSAALASALEPLRPLFLLLTVGILGWAFYQAYKPIECAPDEACARPEDRSRTRIALWILALVALALTTFPYYAGALF